MLLLTATIWGVAFVAQSVGMDYVGPYTFLCTRSILGGLFLLPIIRFMDSRREKTKTVVHGDRKMLIIGGICCGVALCLASIFQQIGIQYTTVGKAGFITACYIVIVPILGLLFRKKCGPAVAGAVALSLAGLYLLCMTGGESASVNRGDLLVLACAFLFAIHIMVIDFFSPVVDGVKMSCIQFFVCAAVSGVGMFLFETPSPEGIKAAALPILYAGVMSSGVGYTLQIVGQKGMNPTISSLIMSLESSISVLAGWILLGQKLSGREILGCVLMFAAIMLAQIPTGGRKEA